jgi:hypothetical protein
MESSRGWKEQWKVVIRGFFVYFFVSLHHPILYILQLNPQNNNPSLRKGREALTIMSNPPPSSPAPPSPIKNPRWSPVADPSAVRWYARDGRREKRKNQRDVSLSISVGLGQFIPYYSSVGTLN